MLENFQPWIDYKKLIENQSKGTIYRLEQKESSNMMLRSDKKSSSKRMVKHLNKHK